MANASQRHRMRAITMTSARNEVLFGAEAPAFGGVDGFRDIFVLSLLWVLSLIFVYLIFVYLIFVRF